MMKAIEQYFPVQVLFFYAVQVGYNIWAAFK